VANSARIDAALKDLCKGKFSQCSGKSIQRSRGDFEGEVERAKVESRGKQSEANIVRGGRKGFNPMDSRTGEERIPYYVIAPSYLLFTVNAVQSFTDHRKCRP